MPGGSSGVTSAMAVCTSTAALSISRSRLNCSVIWVLPVPLDEVIESRPAMVVNCRSSTVATDDAMVAGSAPGRLACTFSVGKSTLGRSLTGSVRYATTPNKRNGRHQQAGGDRPPDEDLREVHANSRSLL